MLDLFDSFYVLIIDTINSMGVYGAILGSLLIILESIIPPLPLFVFITINFVSFGKVLGFIISWLCTCIGCMISYLLVKHFLRNFIVSKIKNINLLVKCMSYLENLSLSKIMVVLAIPFTPAFMLNIAAGICNIDFKKYLISVLVGKLFMVYFWGIVGTGLLESLHNPRSLITVIIIVLLSYVVSIIIKKVFKID